MHAQSIKSSACRDSITAPHFHKHAINAFGQYLQAHCWYMYLMHFGPCPCPASTTSKVSIFLSFCGAVSPVRPWALLLPSRQIIAIYRHRGHFKTRLHLLYIPVTDSKRASTTSATDDDDLFSHCDKNTNSRNTVALPLQQLVQALEVRGSHAWLHPRKQHPRKSFPASSCSDMFFRKIFSFVADHLLVESLARRCAHSHSVSKKLM